NYILVPHFAEILIIEDAAQDARLALNPFVVGPPHVRFYAGAPLVGSRGERYGTLCVADLVPRKFKAEAYSLLINFAHLVVEDSKWPMMYANAQFEKTSGLKDVIGRKTSGTSSSATSRRGWNSENCHRTGGRLQDAYRLPKHRQVSGGAAVAGNQRPAGAQQGDQHPGLGGLPGDDPPLSKSVQDRIMTKGDKDTVVRDCKCFWFVVICDQRTLTEDNLKNAGYRSFARQPSGDSTRTGTSAANDLETSSVMSSLSSSWSSFYGDYPLPPKLNGVLELGPLLGSGSFGKAYRAMSKDKEAMAVKVVDCRKRDDKAIQEQLKEVQLSAALKHPNVVKTLEYATSTGSTKGKQIETSFGSCRSCANWGTSPAPSSGASCARTERSPRLELGRCRRLVAVVGKHS
ncbi:unnamed protein product, partial [Effrenium voratum]